MCIRDSPYTPLTIDALAARAYGGGLIEIVDTLETTATFARYLIKYPSDAVSYTHLDVYKRQAFDDVTLLAVRRLPE